MLDVKGLQPKKLKTKEVALEFLDNSAYKEEEEEEEKKTKEKVI